MASRLHAGTRVFVLFLHLFQLFSSSRVIFRLVLLAVERCDIFLSDTSVSKERYQSLLSYTSLRYPLYHSSRPNVGATAARMGVTTLATASRGTTSSGNGAGDGFVDPVDMRRKAKLRASVHSLVVEVVENALTLCIPAAKTSLISPENNVKQQRSRRTGGGGGGFSASTAATAVSVPPRTAAPQNKTPFTVRKNITAAKTATASRRTSPGQSALASKAVTVPPKPPLPPPPVSLTRAWPSPAESLSSAPRPAWDIPTTGPPVVAQGSGGGGRSRNVSLQAAIQMPPPAPTPPPTPSISTVHSGTAVGPAVAQAVAKPRRQSSRLGSPRPREAGGGDAGGGTGVGDVGGTRLVTRRREPRRESRRDAAAIINDADERMSWSSFDSLDVRVDDQVRARGERWRVCCSSVVR